MRRRRSLRSTRACVPHKEPTSQNSSTEMGRGKFSQQSALRFFHGENLIGSNLVQDLPDATRPANFHILDDSIFSEAEVYPAIARPRVSDCRGCLVPLGS